MVAFIGGGNMAEAIIKGMVHAGMRDIVVSEPREERRSRLESSYGVRTTGDNREAASMSEVVVLAVKPQDMAGVLDDLAGVVGAEKTVVSIAAGITLSYLKGRLRTSRLVRVMPNVASMAQEGMAVMSLCECFDDRAVARVRDIFMASGKVLTLPEKHMDAVTALSGSGPAFIALFVSLMAEAGAGMGLGEQDASMLASQTLAGTARLIEGGMSPQGLIEAVRSPGGTTAAGLGVFEEMGLRGMVAAALEAARKRAGQLAR